MKKVSKTGNQDKQGEKRPYESPEIKVHHIELEHSIAAGSALVKPINTDGNVMEEWEEDPDDNRTFNW